MDISQPTQKNADSCSTALAFIEEKNETKMQAIRKRCFALQSDGLVNI